MIIHRKALHSSQVESLRSLWDDSRAIRGGRVRVKGRDVPPARSHRDCYVVPVDVPEWLPAVVGLNLAPSLSLIRYQQGHHIAWHVDALGLRRSNVIVGLSDDYDGGELQTRTHSVKLQSGDVAIIPIEAEHRVTAVTRGERWVAVTWEVAESRGRK